MDDCLTQSLPLFAASPSFWADPATYLAILKVVFGLGAVIFVHELGHFLVAKLCGVKCEKFYVGFDVPIRLFGQTIIPGKLVHFQWGETEYGIGAIPLGGYVKMLGQDDNPGNVEEQLQGSLAEGESAESAILPSGLVDRTKLDPRSYMAKSVPKRMAIISAGVIFNLIFAVIFASIAFRSGVDYEPAVMGNVVGGGPAWKHDLVGAKITGIGDRKIGDDEYFPYTSFAEKVIFHGNESAVPITFIPHGKTEPVTVEMTPEVGFRRQLPDLAFLGVSSAMIPVIGEAGTVPETPAAKADPKLEPGDRIVSINGQAVESEIDVRRVLARNASKPTTLVLERKLKDGSTKTVTTELGVNPAREIGFGTEWGPIAVIKVDSPAEKAGLQIGDEIVEINGKSRGNLMTVDQRMIDLIRDEQPVTLQIRRDGESMDISIEPVIPKLFPEPGPNKPVAIDSLGVAVASTWTIDFIKPGSAADEAGIETGDQLVSVKYLLNETQKADDRYSDLKKKDTVEFAEEGKETSWAEVYGLLQAMEIGTEIELSLKRDGNPKTVTLKTRESADTFLPKRGFYLAPLKENYQSTSWGDAFKYGFFQVGEDLKRVGTTLMKLVKGKISPTHLGGPGTIAVAATSEAMQGSSRLLLFLTFLSANLAIVNFLPIPVLDGGHMAFLAYEGIFKRPVSERAQIALTYGGLIFILSLMAFVIFLDVGRISAWM